MRLQHLRCVQSSLTKIATIPVEICTLAEALRHTFNPSCRPDVILVIIFFVPYYDENCLLIYLITSVRFTNVHIGAASESTEVYIFVCLCVCVSLPVCVCVCVCCTR